MKTTSLCTCVLLSALLSACGGGGSDSGSTPVPTAPQDVTIQFAAVAGTANTAVACGTQIGALGNKAGAAQLTDLRFYVTNVQLVNDKGVAVPVTLARNDWQQTSGSNTVTLIDLENAQGACGSEGTAATNAVITGTVPAGTYTQLKYTVGVPETMSHSDVMAAAAPLDIMAMGWSWQAGRKFVKIEVNPVGGVSAAGGGSSGSTYYLHLASTNCSGRNDGSDTCVQKNLSTVTLPFNAATQRVAVDVAAVFAGADITVNQNDAVGCMSALSDLDCAAIFSPFGLDLATGTQAATAQTVFRAIAK